MFALDEDSIFDEIAELPLADRDLANLTRSLAQLREAIEQAKKTLAKSYAMES